MSIDDIKKLLRELGGDDFYILHMDSFQIDNKVVFLELPKNLRLN